LGRITIPEVGHGRHASNSLNWENTDEVISAHKMYLLDIFQGTAGKFFFIYLVLKSVFSGLPNPVIK